MGDKAGYILITIGLFFLALNLRVLNFSIFFQPQNLPILFIIVGLVEVLVYYVNLGGFGSVLKTIAGLTLAFFIIFNIGTLVSRFIAPSVIINNVNYVSMHDEPFLNVEGSSVSAGFTNFNLASEGNVLSMSYTDESDNTVLSYLNFESGLLYNISVMFSNSNINFGEVSREGNSLVLESLFSDTNLNNIKSFDESELKNVFGDLTVRTGEITGEKTIILESTFGSADLYIDSSASHWIESSSAFGSVNNNVGLKSNDYDTAIDKVHVIIKNAFGTVNIIGE